MAGREGRDESGRGGKGRDRDMESDGDMTRLTIHQCPVVLVF